MGPEYKDYYANLGVSKTATEKEIKAAYRKLARKFHPDVNQGDKKAEDRFKEVGEAYGVLSDAEKRKKYDQYGDQWRDYSQSGAPGGNAGGAPRGGGFSADYGAGAPDMNDFFASLFGDQGFGGGAGGSRYGGARSAPPRRGQDVETTITVSLEDAFHGATRSLSLTIPNGRYDVGRGREDSTTRKADIKVPSGVAEGQKIRLSGQGADGAGGPGDLYLIVHIAPHPQFERVGDDLNVDVPVLYTEAALGGEIRVSTIKGANMTMRIPPGTQSGQKFRLASQGMPKLRGTGHGDLYARVKITVPKQLSDRERELLTELSGLHKADK